MVHICGKDFLLVAMALGNGSAANGGVTQEKAPVVNGTNMETLPRSGKQVKFFYFFIWTNAGNQSVILFSHLGRYCMMQPGVKH